MFGRAWVGGWVGGESQGVGMVEDGVGDGFLACWIGNEKME